MPNQSTHPSQSAYPSQLSTTTSPRLSLFDSPPPSSALSLSPLPYPPSLSLFHCIPHDRTSSHLSPRPFWQTARSTLSPPSPSLRAQTPTYLSTHLSTYLPPRIDNFFSSRIRAEGFVRSMKVLPDGARRHATYIIIKHAMRTCHPCLRSSFFLTFSFLFLYTRQYSYSFPFSFIFLPYFFAASILSNVLLYATSTTPSPSLPRQVFL